MFGNKTPFLFPHESIPYLREIRDDAWAALVDRVTHLPETEKESLAFQLMMIRICGCLRCTNYKASLGCTVCSQRAVRNSKAPSGALIRWYAKASEEVNEFFQVPDVQPDTSPNEESDPARKAA